MLGPVQVLEHYVQYVIGLGNMTIHKVNKTAL